MSELINTSLNTVSADFTPTKQELLIQHQGLSKHAKIDIEGRLDSAADFVTLLTLRDDDKEITRMVALPMMRFSLSQNDENNTVKLWAVEL